MHADLRPMALQLEKLGSSVLGISLGYWKNFSFDMRKRSLVAFHYYFVFWFFLLLTINLLGWHDSNQMKRKFEILHSVWFFRCVKIFLFWMCVKIYTIRQLICRQTDYIKLCNTSRKILMSWTCAAGWIYAKIEYIYIFSGTT